MRTLPVHWHEGMFLRPHHFQASDRFWADQVRQGSRWDIAHNWGVRRIDIDQPALKNYRFVVNQLQARMRDGTIIRVPQDASLAEKDLREAFARGTDTVDVLLAVPTLEVTRANASGDDARFKIEAPPGGVPDENNGLNARPLQFRRLNLSLLTSGQDPAGYETLPLASIARSTQGEGTAILHRPFIPPLLSCDAWPVLKNDILGAIYQKIGQLVRQLAETVKTRQITFLDTDAEARQMFEGLRLLNEGAAAARLVARTDGLHPLAAYVELCRLIGQFAVFNAQSPSCPELPDYDHDNLGECFFTVKRYLDELLNATLFDLKFQQRPFSGHGLQMRVDMEEPWLAPGWSMYIGVQSNLQPGEVIALLKAAQMNMKIASSDRVEEVYSRGLRGLEFQHEPQPPRVLPITKDNTYFVVNRSQDEWPFVLRTRRLAVRLNERLLQGDLDGKDKVLIRGQPGREPVMRLVLYIVPPRG